MLPLKRRRSTFSPPPTALEHQAVPVITTMIASLGVLIPVVATQPIFPPFGLMVFLGWRLLRNDIWPLWMGIPLGFWDDLFSGQPLGSAMAGWTLVMLALDQLDRRLPFRSHSEDWAIAVGAIAGYLALAALLAGGATSLIILIPQLFLSALLFPLIARLCAALDRWRGNR
jgi:rod shape-determining protein MreD